MHLRSALSHLYDADRLRQNPLVAYFGLSQRFDACAVLRGNLIDAIGALKPKLDDPAQERAWRVYESLYCCYVQQLSQQVVADQLAMSPRQLRREQQEALELLADQLWEKYQPRGLLSGAPEALSPDTSPTISPEFAWLKEALPENPSGLGDELTRVMELAQPLAAQSQVRLTLNTPDPLPPLAVHPVALHQIMLNLLGIAIPRVRGGEAAIEARLSRWEAVIRVRCAAPMLSATPVTPEEAASLNIAQQLTELSGGQLHVALAPGEPFEASLTLSALQRLPVLVVDDNADALSLFLRYTNGTRYRVIGTQDPGRVLSLAEEHSPQVVVLDVMMPRVDGWMELGRLRQHPLTERVPIVVCTILPQEKLALSLGASAFLKKPVTRQAFLPALHHHPPPPAKTLHSPPLKPRCGPRPTGRRLA